MNKFGAITKDFFGNNESKIDYMQLINQFSRKTLTEDDVYIFPVALCNNDIDRDNERFTVESLNELSRLYLGKTGISNHDWKSENQNSRIFYTSVNKVPNKVTKTGEDFYELDALCYMLKSEKNKELIDEIDAGIKKEVSVGCSIGKATCSICGRDYETDVNCTHFKGREYGGKTCYVSLENPLDVYEWSFVVVPSQPEAGITKAYEKEKNKEKEKKIMFVYDEKLKEFGIDEETFKGFNVDAETASKIAKASQPTIKEGMTAESFVEFISKDAATVAIGSEKTSEEVLEMLKTYQSNKQLAEKYESIFNQEIEDTLKEGIKAKGEEFNSDRWKKFLKTCDYEEVKGYKEEWHNEAAKSLHAGERVSEPIRNTRTREKLCESDIKY